MNTIGVLLDWIICAVAVKQAAYILMHGSIFNSLRDSVQTGASAGRFWFKVLNQIFGCQLCMTTQLSIWFVGMPLLYAGHFAGDWYLGTVKFTAAVFATSGLAIWFWNTSEYQVTKFRIAEDQHQNIIGSLRHQLATANVVPMGEILDEEMFLSFIASLDTRCGGIWCSILRMPCRREGIQEQVNSWMREGRITAPQSAQFLIASEEVMPRYFQYAHVYRGKDLPELQQRTFQEFKAVL